MVVVPISWSGRHWALPFLTVLAPSARWSEKHRKRHKTLTDWARQAILQTKRWLPNRLLIFVADSGFAALELLASVRWHVCVITRLRLDAALFKPPPRRRKGQRGRPPLKGRRLPTLRAVLASKKTVWSTVVVSQWYNAQQRKLLTATGTAVWYHAGIPPVPIRWVLVMAGLREIRPPVDEIGLQKRIAVDGTTHSDTALNCGVRWDVSHRAAPAAVIIPLMPREALQSASTSPTMTLMPSAPPEASTS
jgi:hypothetical protein